MSSSDHSTIVQSPKLGEPGSSLPTIVPTQDLDYIPVEGPEGKIEGGLNPPSDPQVQLSSEQQHVLEQILNGRSIFFTGSAGTGKSVLLRESIRCLKNAGKQVAVTASTGIAGLNIGGSTLHSFAGVGLGKQNIKFLIARVMRSRMARERWEKTDVLVIDEISMIDGVFLDKLDSIGRAVRSHLHNVNIHKPFGGMQLIICGDFYQLPPVPDTLDGANVPITFAFDAQCWKTCIQDMFTLTHVFRQKDQAFIDILNEMRLGSLSENATSLFQSLSREVVYSDKIEPSELYPIRAEVAEANRKRLLQLPDQPQERYIAHDYPGFTSRGEVIRQSDATKLLGRLVATKEITLRIGAQVMLIINLADFHLVNGSTGRVTEFLTRKEAKPRGILSATFNPDGVNPEDGVPVTPKGPTPVQPKTIDENRKWPVVEFVTKHGMLQLLCVPLGFTLVNVFGQVESQRDQIPLILAWALSIHKSQGQTLERVKIDLGRVFEKGQAYVGLSRATSLATLQVLNFTPSKVQAHPRVIEWTHKNLRAILSTRAAAPPRVRRVSNASTTFEDLDDFDESVWQEAAATW